MRYQLLISLTTVSILLWGNPLPTSAISITDFITFAGDADAETEGAGDALAGGDINGDGYDDIVVGAPNNSIAANEAGAVYVLYGQEDVYTDMNLSTAVRYTGENTDDEAGSAVAVGDVNGDGYDDILIGAPGFYGGKGNLYVIFGESAELIGGSLSDSDASLRGKVASDQAGFSVANVGDVNNDGYEDTLVGAPYNDDTATNAGSVYLVLGGASWSTRTRLALNETYNGEVAGDYAGFAVSGAGDLNNDGFDDMAIGAPGNEDGGTSSGAAYIVYGNASFASSNLLSGEIELSGGVDNSVGYALSPAGDLNNDGFDDMAIGAPTNSDYAMENGAAYFVYGQSSTLTAMTLNNSANSFFYSTETSDQFGNALSLAGELSNDDYNDFWIGGSANNNNGKVFFTPGYPESLPTTNVTEVTLYYFSGTVEKSLANAKLLGNIDVNNDGYGELVIGQTSANSGDGSVYLGYLKIDSDGDGVTGSTGLMFPGPDCDDNDASKRGNNNYYLDGDGDGLGSDTTTTVCGDTVPSGYVRNSNDTDDTYYNTYSNTTDSDGDGTVIANDCDDADGTVSASQTYYEDNDGDGLGSDTQSVVCAATAPAGYAANSVDNNDDDYDNDGQSSAVDCDDTDSTVSVDSIFFEDSDGDGLGSDTTTTVCGDTVPSGYVRNSNDTDDTYYNTYSNTTDSDGDGTVIADDCNDDDSTVSVTQTYYQDSDGDGLGSPSQTTIVCSSTPPTGYVTNYNDTDDTVTNSTVDSDGDGVMSNYDCNDDDPSVSTAQVYYEDSDGDGLGSANAISLCSAIPPTGYVSNSNDSDDTYVNTVLEYTGDEIDNDGDGEIDEVNTIEENGLHPEYSGTDPTNKSDYVAVITAITSARNGDIKVRFSDGAVYRYDVFAASTTRLTKVNNYKNRGFLSVLHPRGKQLALMNVYNGEIYDTAKLSKKKFNQLSLKHLDARSDGSTEAIVTLKKKTKIKLVIVKIKTSTYSLTKRDSANLTNGHISPKKTKVKQRHLLLRNGKGKVKASYLVSKKYKLRAE